MHPNPVFHTADATRNLAFAAERAFGTLAVNGPDGPLLSHVPFLVTGELVELHLVRSNPIARMLKEPVKACLSVIGPDSYVSPDWYETDDQVPTWNYVAVHLRGQLVLQPQETLHDLLDQQSALFEEQLAPKKPWTTDKMTPEVRERMMRAILPCAMAITSVNGTWKLNQNKDAAARLRAADQVARHGMGAACDALADLMREA